MASLQSDTRQERILVLTPTGRDPALVQRVLSEEGLAAQICESLDELCRNVHQGAGVLLLAEEALLQSEMHPLLELLEQEPSWSDTPIVVLISGPAEQSDNLPAIRTLKARANVTLLERPVRIVTLTSTLQACLRARRRQYEVRGHLERHERSERALQKQQSELQSLNETLEQRVGERTALAEEQAAQLRFLALELTHAEQRERRQLARVIHDNIQQLIVAMKWRLGRLHKQSSAKQQQIVREVDELLDQLMQTSRSLTTQLSPPVLYDRGLGPALEWLGRLTETEYGLKVDVDADPAVEAVNDDVALFLLQAVRELLFNVVLHGQTDQAHVTLSHVGDDQIQIVVQDEGVGFDSTTIEKQPADSEHFGLFSIEQRLGLLGGHFEIATAPNRGTRVMLRIPCSPQGAKTMTTEKQVLVESDGDSRKTGSNAGPRKIRILLADDHKLVRQGLVSLLTQEPDFEIIGEASDGQMAVEMAQQLKPDVVGMDVSMPKLDGVEATRRITATLPDVRVIGLSMYDQDELAGAMNEAGAVAYLRKDGPCENLIATIRQVSQSSHPQIS